MSNTRTSVYLSGVEFRLKSDKTDDHMQKMAIFVNRRLLAMEEKCPEYSTSDCALLAMLQLADEYHDLMDSYKRLEGNNLDLRTNRAREPVVKREPVKRPFEMETRP